MIVDGYSYTSHTDAVQIYPTATFFHKRSSSTDKPYLAATYKYYNIVTELGIVLQKRIELNHQNYIIILGINPEGAISGVLVKGPMIIPDAFCAAFIGRRINSSFDVAQETRGTSQPANRIPPIQDNMFASQFIANGIQTMLFDYLDEFRSIE